MPARLGFCPIACRTTPGASGRHGSNPDVSEVRASSPPRPLRLTVHIPGVVVPAVDSDNESDCVTSLSTFSLDSSVSSGYARKATNTTIKLMQNGGKAVRTNRIVDDRQGTRGAHAAPALLPGAGLIVPPRVRCGCVTVCVDVGHGCVGDTVCVCLM